MFCQVECNEGAHILHVFAVDSVVNLVWQGWRTHCFRKQSEGTLCTSHANRWYKFPYCPVKLLNACTCALLRVTQHSQHLNNNARAMCWSIWPPTSAASHTDFRWKDRSHLTRHDVYYRWYGQCKRGSASSSPTYSQPLPFFRRLLSSLPSGCL